MRRSIVTILAAGGLLALGAWTTPGQSADPVPAEPAERSQADDTCMPVQATANAHRRRAHALDQALGRDTSRPRASSARPSADPRCTETLTPLNRNAQRQRRNAAIDRSLRG